MGQYLVATGPQLFSSIVFLKCRVYICPLLYSMLHVIFGLGQLHYQVSQNKREAFVLKPNLMMRYHVTESLKVTRYKILCHRLMKDSNSFDLKLLNKQGLFTSFVDFITARF